MALNVTTAVIGSGCNTATATPSLAQWDQGQVLKIEGVDLPAAYQVEFSTEYTRNAIQKIGNANGVAVPNELLQRSAPITAYVVLHEGENDRETEYWITIHITPRTPPETITPDPEELSVIDETIAALQDGVAAAEAAAESVQNMGVEAETLASGSQASVEKTVDPETGEVTLSFGIPRGNQGNPGTTPDFRIGTVETLPATSPATATITGTPAEPVLNLGIPQGQKGDPGGSSGTTDYRELDNKPQINGHTLNGDQSASDLGLGTYSKPGTGIPKTDLASDVQQSLGKADSALQSAPVSSVAGKTGAVQLNAGDIEFADSEIYAAGSVGAELSDVKNAIDAKQDAPSSSGTAGQVLGLDSNLDPVWVNQSGGGGDTSNCAPIIINTASGDIASFADGADNRQIRKIVGTIVPQQSGTGDPSPTNVRPISGWTGANIFDASNASRLSAKNAQFDILPIQNGTGTPTPTNVRNIDPGLSFTLDNGTVVDIYRGDITFHVDGTATLISRYANRIFDGSELFTGWFNETRHIATSVSIQDASHEDGTSGYCNRYKIMNAGSNLTNADTYSCAFGGTRSSHILYVKDERYSTLEEFNTGCVGLQIVYPLFTPVTYELSEAETVRAFAALGVRVKGLSINWQTEAGTIYGGTITLYENESVDVVADCANYHILPSDWSYQSSVNAWFVPRRNLSPLYLEKATGATGFYGICDGYPFAPSYANLANNPLPNHIAVRNDGNAKAIYCMTDGTSDIRPVEINIVLKVAEPVTYHFDNIGELYTYFGTNNVWIDTGAITECNYPADTKLYVDGLTAPDEDMIANSNIASGKYFVVNNQLYLSTAAIAAGASIVPGTNCTATNLAEALNAINT